MSKALPPSIGLEFNKPVLYNPYQQEFLKARRMRYAKCCNKIGFCGSDGLFRCPSCGLEQTATATRVYKRIGAFAGRRGGKSVVGAHAAREEMLVPNSRGWVCGPSYEKLHDATMPAILGLIPREWCSHWDAEHNVLTLNNGASVAFRSLDDPDRAHSGVGLHWGWFDEAAFISEEAWDYFRPSLTDYGGVCFFTSSVDGYDWTYKRVEKPARDGKPGFWRANWRTIDNPHMAAFQASEIEEARATMPPQLFRQEYEGIRENFTGSVYGEWIDECWLQDADAVKAFIPEWEGSLLSIDQSRRMIIGLDSGADHPFGATAIVSTEKGMIVVGEYLQRLRAYSSHLTDIRATIPTYGREVLWASNRNEAQLRLEFNAHGIMVAPAENDQEAGIQRVLSWLYTKQLKIAYTCPKTYEQMKMLRYAENTMNDGQKRGKEKVYKKDDELPDCIRYALMTWPTLPSAKPILVGRDLSTMPVQVRFEIEEMARKMSKLNGDERDLTPANKEYPMGDFYGNSTEESSAFGGNFYD